MWSSPSIEAAGRWLRSAYRTSLEVDEPTIGDQATGPVLHKTRACTALRGNTVPGHRTGFAELRHALLSGLLTRFVSPRAPRYRYAENPLGIVIRGIPIEERSADIFFSTELYAGIRQ